MSLYEVQHEWTLIEVLDAHDALDARAEMALLYQEEINRRNQ